MVKSDVYQKLSEFQRAMAYCDRGLVMIKQFEDKYKLAAAYLSKSEIYQAMEITNPLFIFINVLEISLIH